MLVVDGLDLFHGEVPAVRGLSLAVRAGEIVSLVGANGSGKTTTLRAVSGLHRPRAGRITYDGVRLDALAPERIVELGVVQVPEGRKLFPSLTVRENLELGAWTRRARPRRARTLDEVMDRFPRLRERAAQRAGTLSGGEQQMCAIGRGIMSRPKLLMIDELSLGLAPQLVDRLSEALLEINRTGVTILLVEQDVMTAFEIARYGLVIETGRVGMHGTTQQLADDPGIRQAYLGM